MSVEEPTPPRISALACVAGILGLLFLSGTAAAAEGPGWPAARAGMDHLYNLEYDEAIAKYEEALAREPDNLRFLNLLANAYLFQELFRLGELDGNLYASTNRFLEAEKPEPDPAALQRFEDTIGRVRRIAEARLKERENDAVALYSLGVAYALEATRMFTLEKKFMPALRAATRANHLHEQVLEIDPNFHDAKLLTGTYQYVVGSLPWAVRVLAFFIGHRGDKEKGLRLVTEAKDHGTVVNTDAEVLLALGYSREKQHAKAREIFQDLMDRFPRNYLYRLEMGRSYRRDGMPDQALALYQDVLRKEDAGAPGYAKLPADRVHFEAGAIQERLGRREDALLSYAQVTGEGKDGKLLLGYARFQRGEILRELGRRDEAREEYLTALGLGDDDLRNRVFKRLRELGR